MDDFRGYALKAIVEAVLPLINTKVDIGGVPEEFDSFEDILRLYELGPEAPNHPILAEIRKKIPSEFLRSLLPVGGHDDPLKMPLPHVIQSG
jgi:linoleate 9S-lipoxygenase